MFGAVTVSVATHSIRQIRGHSRALPLAVID
jgi:hypothetical protein